MAETVEEIRNKLLDALAPEFRGRLAARGAARALVWRSGVVSSDRPNFGPLLTEELLIFGFGLARICLRARDLQMSDAEVEHGFELAAEVLESVVRNGDPQDPERGFNRIVAAASYHLAGFSARAFSLLALSLEEQNFSIVERALALLVLRRFDELLHYLQDRLVDPALSEDRLLGSVGGEIEPVDPDLAIDAALTENYLRCLSLFIFGLRFGESSSLDACRTRLQEGLRMATSIGAVPMWWIYRLTMFFVDDLWAHSLQKLLPVDGNDESGWPKLRELFVGLLQSRSIVEVELWPSQRSIAQRVLEETRVNIRCHDKLPYGPFGVQSL